MAASSDRLGSLHDRFTRYWENRLEQAELPMDDENWMPFSSADSAVLRAFLKDNNITAEPGGDKELEALGDKLAREVVGNGVSRAELDAIMEDAKAQMGIH
ncbi:terminase small subunit [Pseudomonas phage Eisa9]|uniref:Terminase small subunit n=1 Tax=Pseudomonas phage Eisa9 TaxID=2900148 RepID=A0AAE8YJ78_9CAUD|nr:terminase small subunit [Pseudomonas phage Eisa9]